MQIVLHTSQINYMLLVCHTESLNSKDLLMSMHIFQEGVNKYDHPHPLIT